MKITIDTKEGKQQLRIIRSIIRDVNLALKDHCKLIGLKGLKIEIAGLGNIGEWKVKIHSERKKK